MPNITTSELGGTGTYLINGYLSQHDYNNEMVGWTRIDTYDKMRKGDSTVRAAWLAVTLPIVSADWYIKPASDDAKDKEIADFITKQLFQGKTTWTTKLREILLYLAYGSYVFEKVFKKETDGKIGWEKFGARLPKTIEKWETENDTPGITQWLPTGKRVSIPAWKLLLFVNEQEGDNYEGTSIFRTAHKHWYYKDNYYKIDAMAQERQGLGIPYFKKPPGATDDQVQKAREIMRNIRANEEAYFEFPIGWEFGFVEMEGKSIKSAKDGIDHHNRQILLNILGQFLELGSTGGSGSRALSEDHSDLFLLSEQTVAKYVQEVMNRDAIKELVDLNYTVDKYPTLEFGSIGTIDAATLGSVLTSLATGGILTKNYELERHVRKSLHLPELTEEQYNEAKAEAEKQAMLKFNPIDPKDPQNKNNGKKKNNTKNTPNNPAVDDDMENENNSQSKKAMEVVNDVIEFRDKLNAIIESKSTTTGSSD